MMNFRAGKLDPKKNGQYISNVEVKWGQKKVLLIENRIRKVAHMCIPSQCISRSPSSSEGSDCLVMNRAAVRLPYLVISLNVQQA